MSENLLRALLLGLAMLSLFLYWFSKIAGYQILLIIAACFVGLAAARSLVAIVPNSVQPVLAIAQVGLAATVVVFLIKLFQHVKPFG